MDNLKKKQHCFYILGDRHVLTRIVPEHSSTNNGIDMENIRDTEVVEGDRVDDKVGDGAVVTGEVVGDDDGDVFVD